MKHEATSDNSMLTPSWKECKSTACVIPRNLIAGFHSNSWLRLFERWIMLSTSKDFIKGWEIGIMAKAKAGHQAN